MQLRRDRYGLPGGSVWPTPGLCPGEVGRNASISTYLCRFIENDNADTGAGGVIARRLRSTTAMAEAEANGWMSCNGLDDVREMEWRRRMRVIRENKLFKCKLLWAIEERKERKRKKRELFIIIFFVNYLFFFLNLYDKKREGKLTWKMGMGKRRDFTVVFMVVAWLWELP